MAHHVHDVTLEPENYTTPWDVTNLINTWVLLGAEGSTYCGELIGHS